MSNRHRNIALTTAAVAAGVLASLFRPGRLLAAEAPVYAQVVIGALAVALWLCVLAPIWLPEVISPSWPRLARTLRLGAGALLIAASGVALFLVSQEPGAKSLWLLALVAAVFAARHFHVALSAQRTARSRAT